MERTDRKKVYKEYKVKGVIKDIYYNAPIHPVAPAMFSLQKGRENGHIIFKVKKAHGIKYHRNCMRR